MELDLMRRHAYAISPESLSNEDLRTWANAVTLVRTVGGLVLFSVAAFKHNAAWNLAGLAVYWRWTFSTATLHGRSIKRHVLAHRWTSCRTAFSWRFSI